MIGAHQAIQVGGSKKLWTPAAMVTALWLDAADSSTITTVSGKVSQWNDKSMNGKHATQDVAANRPVYTSAEINGKNVVTFSGPNVHMGNAVGLTSGSYGGTLTLYLVGRRTGSTAFNGGIFSEKTSIPIRGYELNKIDSDHYIISSDGLNADGNHTIGESDYNLTASTFISVHVQKTGKRQQYWLNGTSVAIIEGTTTFDATGTDGYYVGRRVYGGYFEGHIAELIMIDAAFSETVQVKIEGYFAHKWGLVAILPANHPYKLLPPYR